MRGRRTPILLSAGLLAAALLLSCSKREAPRPLQDLPSDEERCLLFRVLSFGCMYADAKALVPALGPAVPGGEERPGTLRAVAPMSLFGRPVTLEALFREDSLVACGYLYTAPDPASAEDFFRLLRRRYVIDLGNFHEERRSGTDGDTTRCFWSMDGTGLHLEWVAGSGRIVRARFFPLPSGGRPAA